MLSESLWNLRWLARWADDPNQTERLALNRPPGDIIPLPQLTWTLLALIHYRRRKRWEAED